MVTDQKNIVNLARKDDNFEEVVEHSEGRDLPKTISYNHKNTFKQRILQGYKCNMSNPYTSMSVGMKEWIDTQMPASNQACKAMPAPICFPTMSFTSDCRTHKSLPRNPFSRRSCNSASVTSDTPTNQVTSSKDLQESAAEDASFGAVGLSLALTGPMLATKRGSKSSCVYHKTSAKDK